MHKVLHYIFVTVYNFAYYNPEGDVKNAERPYVSNSLYKSRIAYSILNFCVEVKLAESGFETYMCKIDSREWSLLKFYCTYYDSYEPTKDWRQY